MGSKFWTEDTQRTARVLIVDDHPVVRAGLTQMINQHPEFQVCGEAGSADDALRAFESERPDVAIIDISLGGVSGLELIKLVRARFSEVPLLVLSMHDEELYAERVLRAGAKGYIRKNEATEKLLKALKWVLQGQIYLSDKMTKRFLDGFISGNPRQFQPPIERLSDRELEVYEMIGRGRKTKEIAEKLHLSVKTVEAHREHIKSKLNLKDSIELLRHATHWIIEEDKDHES